MRLRPTILIEADAPSFTFRYKDARLVLATVLHVSIDEDQIVLAVGERPAAGAKSRCVELFDSPLQPINYSQYLEAFLRHGVSLVSTGWARFVRPHLHIRVSRRLVEWAGGYYDGVFRSAALRAGAPMSQDVTVEADW